MKILFLSHGGIEFVVKERKLYRKHFLNYEQRKKIAKKYGLLELKGTNRYIVNSANAFISPDIIRYLVETVGCFHDVNTQVYTDNGDFIETLSAIKDITNEEKVWIKFFGFSNLRQRYPRRIYVNKKTVYKLYHNKEENITNIWFDKNNEHPDLNIDTFLNKAFKYWLPKDL